MGQACSSQPTPGLPSTVIRAAASFVQQGLGTALLVGREERVKDTARTLGVELGGGIEIIKLLIEVRPFA